MKTFSFLDRKKNIQQIKNDFFDLAIIGGGINGAGVARNAASRGMKVALVEAEDFAFGTSSRSSKLIHGGIRYLENLDFHLVFEALSERKKLFELAPHLVHPLRFVLPIYKNSRVGMFKMGLGMWLYDALSLFQAPKLHERWGKKETLFHVPMLNNNDLCGSYVYSDAYMDDDRLVIETLRSANELGACCTNYVKVISSEMKEGRLVGLNLKDQINNELFTLKAHHFISTAGPWSDQLAQTLLKKWQSRLRPSKGIHITLKKERLTLPQAVVMAADKDKRIVFAIPRHEMVIIGTTDTDYSEDPHLVRSEIDDINYLLKITDEYFPGAKLQANDILMSYAGIRPLVKDGSATEGTTSREHLIISDSRNLTWVAGGKYTTYRKMAEDSVKATLKFFPKEKQSLFKKSETLNPLNPLASKESLLRAHLLKNKWKNETHLSQEIVENLLEQHGLEAVSLIEKCSKTKQNLSIWEIEAKFAIENTMCLNLLDFFLRRTPLILSQADHGLSIIDPISQLFTQELCWSENERLEQIQKVKDYINNELAWKKSLKTN